MTDDIHQWLQERGLGKYGAVFAENGIDLDILAELDDADLKSIGVNLGDRKRLLRATSTSNVAAVADKAERKPTAAERRQLTVMFCDLVGSTALSQRLDPEDLRDVMRRYQDAVAGAVTRYGGHVAKYLGDGVLAYFGWPQAYEDQAERAVRAGLDAVLAVAGVHMANETALAARVGIATGQVVVGDLVGESGRDSEAVTGETPNLAARLENIAEPGQVVVGDITRQLLGQTFAMEDLGAHALKGFDDAVPVWRIGHEILVESRFEAAHGAASIHLVGRDSELQLLLERWRLARAGEGQIVLLSGEAGIGKSGLIQALSDQVASSDHIRVRYQCSPYHGNSALYPSIQQLHRAANIAPGDNSGAKLDKIESILKQSGDDIAQIAPLFAHLLSVPFEHRYGALPQTPEQIKTRLLDALTSHLLRLADLETVLFLFEDAHWIDPTSQELLELAIGRISSAQVLIVVTHRPEWQPQASGHNHVTSLQLNRLSRNHGAEIVRAVAGEFVPDDVVARIVERTDGVPLFIEELTKSLVESGLDIADAEIPTTLRASLLARIDRLAPKVKEIAQIGAVIGREFAHDLLIAVADSSESTLEDVLTKLLRSELVFRTGVPPLARYTFKHALIQDAIYDSMLRELRQGHHARIALVLSERFPDIAETAPELLAHHFSEAGQDEPATEYWHRAGLRSAARSANAEALVQLNHGLETLGRLPDTDERARQELALYTDLTGPLVATVGYGSEKLAENFTKAIALAEKTGEARGVFPILYGRYIFHLVTGQVVRAGELADEFLSLAKRQNHFEPVVLGHRLVGTAQFISGAPSAAEPHVLAAANADMPEAGRSPPHVYGQDVEAAASCYGALLAWQQGYPEQSLAIADRALSRAVKLDHPNTTGYVLMHMGLLVSGLRHEEKTRSILAKLQQLTDNYDMPLWRVAGKLTEFSLTAIMGNNRAAIGQFDCFYPSYIEDFHMKFFLPGMWAMKAEVHVALEEAEAALESIHQATLLADETGEQWQIGEIMRIRAIALRLNGDHGGAAEMFELALDKARSGSLRMYELRIATDFARFLRDQGDPQGARDLLAPVYGWFTEGFEMPDLIDAKALLDELN